MKTRSDAVKLIERQLKEGVDDSNGFGKKKTRIDARPKGEHIGYGVQELRELLDFIYGPPTDESEKISTSG